MARRILSPLPLSLAALLVSSALHAQSVGGVVRRSGVPAAPVSAAPVYNSAPTYNNTAPSFNNNSASVYSTGPAYRIAPSAPVVSQSAPTRVYSNPVYSNAPVYQNAPIFRNGAGQNVPVYQMPYPNTGFVNNGFVNNGFVHQNTLRNNNAPIYRSNTPRQTTPPFSRTFGDPNAPAHTGPAVIGRAYRITTPHGSHNYPSGNGNNNYPVYNTGPNYGYTGSNTTILLGGYYYGNYCDVYAPGAFPSVYGYYTDFPTYIIGPGVSVVVPSYPVYVTSYLPFDAPSYPVAYNENNYYVGSQERVREISNGGEEAQQAIRKAVPAGSFQAAFGDIEQAWQTGNIGLLRKHIRDEDTKVSVFLKNKYAYSLASGDLIQITRDAFDRLDTVSFQFDHLRKAKNGDVTAYGQHVYHSRDGVDSATPGGDAVPFTTDGGTGGNADASAPSVQDKTVYVSYTLRHGNGLWYIVGVNSSTTPVIQQ